MLITPNADGILLVDMATYCSANSFRDKAVVVKKEDNLVTLNSTTTTIPQFNVFLTHKKNPEGVLLQGETSLVTKPARFGPVSFGGKKGKKTISVTNHDVAGKLDDTAFDDQDVPILVDKMLVQAGAGDVKHFTKIANAIIGEGRKELQRQSSVRYLNDSLLKQGGSDANSAAEILYKDRNFFLEAYKKLYAISGNYNSTFNYFLKMSIYYRPMIVTTALGIDNICVKFYKGGYLGEVIKAKAVIFYEPMASSLVRLGPGDVTIVADGERKTPIVTSQINMDNPVQGQPEADILKNIIAAYSSQPDEDFQNNFNNNVQDLADRIAEAKRRSPNDPSAASLAIASWNASQTPILGINGTNVQTKFRCTSEGSGVFQANMACTFGADVNNTLWLSNFVFTIGFNIVQYFAEVNLLQQFAARMREKRDQQLANERTYLAKLRADADKRANESAAADQPTDLKPVPGSTISENPTRRDADDETIGDRQQNDNGSTVVTDGATLNLDGLDDYCWLAREVYGQDSLDWRYFREWIITFASPQVKYTYILFAKLIARFIKNKSFLKKIIKIWMDKNISEIKYYGNFGKKV